MSIPSDSDQDRIFGLGDSSFTAFFSPKDSGKLTWGIGPVVLIPTATDDALAADEWGAGLSAVVLGMPGNWVVGSLFSNVWTQQEDDGTSDVLPEHMQSGNHFTVKKQVHNDDVLALNKDNDMVITASGDYAFWVEDLSEAIGHMARKLGEIDVSERELWLRGRASPRFEAELDGLGWNVRQQIQQTEKIKEQFIQPAEQ